MRITFFLLSSFMVLAVASCGDKKPAKQSATSQAITVVLAKPGQQQAGVIDASGEIESTQTAQISTRVMGYITQLRVKAGDRVRSGQALVTINSQDMQAKRAQTDAGIAEAEAYLAQASKDLDRFKTLYQQQSASAKELEQITLQYQSASARAKAAREMRQEVNAMLQYTTLTAPFDGVVVLKHAEEGTLASPGMPILTIEKSGVFQASVQVPEIYMGEVKVGDMATITVKSSGNQFTAKVNSVIPSSQYTGGSYTVKLPVPDSLRQKLYSGMYVQASFTRKQAVAKTETLPGVWIPEAALVRRDQLTGVYTVSAQQTALLRWVKMGKSSAGMIEVLSGLDPSESFIVHADGKLSNGVSVQVK